MTAIEVRGTGSRTGIVYALVRSTLAPTSADSLRLRDIAHTSRYSASSTRP